MSKPSLRHSTAAMPAITSRILIVTSALACLTTALDNELPPTPVAPPVVVPASPSDGVITFSNITEPSILSSETKTHMMLLANTSAEYWGRVRASFEAVANEDSSKVLHIVVPSQIEKAAKTKFFRGIDYHPAIIIASRKTGQYARPEQAFSAQEMQDLQPHLSAFKKQFLDHFRL